MKINNNFKARLINDKKEWENFNLSLNNPSFFQSWGWGEVQKKNGVEVDRYGFYLNDKLIGISEIFNIKAKRGHFIHIRQGPVIEKLENSNLFFEVLNYLIKFAKEKKVSFIRISPLIKVENKNINNLKKLGFLNSPIHNIDAENRWILNLKEDNTNILSNMRKTTRYLIRKGENMSIKIIRSKKVDDIKKFLSLYSETAKIKDFVPHSLIKEEFEEFCKDESAILYFAKLNNKVLATAFIVYYGNEAIYRHGATSIEGRNTPASYLLQWEAIKDAKNKGLSVYNFWGITKDNNPKNPWFGLTQFKKGFGGEQFDFIHSMDLPLKKTYWISYLIDYFTKIKKGHT